MTYTWQEITAKDAPCPRSSAQISAVGSRVYVFGGETGPRESHFGYGEPVASTLHCLDLDKPDEWATLDCESAPSPRMGHGQAIVSGAERTWLYVFGGRQPEEPDAVYDGSEKIRSLNDMYRICVTGKGERWERVECTGVAQAFVFAITHSINLRPESGWWQGTVGTR